MVPDSVAVQAGCVTLTACSLCPALLGMICQERGCVCVCIRHVPCTTDD